METTVLRIIALLPALGLPASAGEQAQWYPYRTLTDAHDPSDLGHYSATTMQQTRMTVANSSQLLLQQQLCSNESAYNATAIVETTCSFYVNATEGEEDDFDANFKCPPGFNSSCPTAGQCDYSFGDFYFCGSLSTLTQEECDAVTMCKCL